MVHLKFPKRVDLTCSHHTNTQKMLTMWGNRFVHYLDCGDHSQCTSKHQGVHLKYMQLLLVSYTSVKLEKKSVMLQCEVLPLISDLCRCSGKREVLPTQQPSVFLITHRIFCWKTVTQHYKRRREPWTWNNLRFWFIASSSENLCHPNKFNAHIQFHGKTL